MAVLVALLRGINVGGNKRVPMAELVSLAKAIGCATATTYIQSGNLIVTTKHSPPDLEVELERALQKKFGFEVVTIVRTAKEWRSYAEGSPFPDAEKERPQLLHLGLTKGSAKAGATEMLEGYAKAGERVHVGRNFLWVDFLGGAGSSKITPNVLDRALGSTVTMRNWKSVLAIAAMLPK
ncbi:MAG: DUF1697 domain-containing protein [Polyangiaceae bacterium]